MIDNLTEAINHAREVAKENRNKARLFANNPFYGTISTKCEECATEHEQLAGWLEELKAVKDIVDHWNDENSSFVSATIAFEKILDVFKESEDSK